MLQHLPRDDWPFDGGGSDCVCMCMCTRVRLCDTGGLMGDCKISLKCVKVHDCRRGGKIKGPHTPPPRAVKVIDGDS